MMSIMLTMIAPKGKKLQGQNVQPPAVDARVIENVILEAVENVNEMCDWMRTKEKRRQHQRKRTLQKGVSVVDVSG